MALFPAFARLPNELQRIIWEAAIPSPCPTAYLARLTIQPRHRNEDGSIGRNHKKIAHFHDATKNGPAQSEFINMLSSLLLCCKAASDVATAAYQRHRAYSPILLRGLRHEVEVNTSRDLLMLQDGWQSHTHKLSIMVKNLEAPRTLDNLAIIWPGPEAEKFYGFNCLINLLHMWENLNAFYVIVDPKYLEVKPWIPDEDRCWDHGNAPDGCLSTFLHTYGLDQSRYKPGIFYDGDGDRVYYEVGVNVLAKAGGLEQVAELLFNAQEILKEDHKDEEEERPKCIILSWKHM
ncbi:hypothetical protein QQS21_009890 [Conoideocrella luteorostrata]|uniref:2EXR domain-containing protein n=1 Tax=Conoideocrella luteorostrata TaxID=1105319 RepID=A0AAJ0FPY1_9HYPO|nr:hypothetical protein QQS21_009890 [Conoideocrella luteorostrata]